MPHTKYRYFRIIIIIFIILPFSYAAAQKSKVDSLETLLKYAVEDTVKVKILNDLCWEIQKSDPQKALKYGNASLYLSDKNNYTKGKATANNCIGAIYVILGENIKAKEYYLKSFEDWKKIGNTKGIANSLNNIGTIYYYTSDYPKALEYFSKSLIISESTLYSYGIGLASNSIGLIYSVQKKYDKALEYYEKSLNIAMLLSDNQQMCQILCSIGLIYYKKNELHKALEYYQQSLKISEEIKFKTQTAFTLGCVADIYDKWGLQDKAIEYYNKSLEISNKIGDKSNIAISYICLGEIYKSQKNYKKALTCFDSSFTVAQQSGYKDIIMSNYENLAEMYAEMGNFSMAYKNYHKYHKLNDSIFNKEKNKQILELQTKYETEKKTREIELLKKDNDLKSLKIDKNRMIFIAVSAFALMGIIVIVFLFYNYRLRQRHRHLIFQREAEKKVRDGVIEAEINERKRFSEDLHDGLGPLLSGIKMYIHKLELGDVNEAEKKELLQEAGEFLDDAINNTRTIANNLMPTALSEKGLIEALKVFCNKINLAQKITIQFNSKIEKNIFDITTGMALYKVITELINNTLKHADASGIFIDLYSVQNKAVFEYSDNGKGFDLQAVLDDPQKGLGLMNIKNRIEALEGACAFESAGGKGLKVVIEVKV